MKYVRNALLAIGLMYTGCISIEEGDRPPYVSKDVQVGDTFLDAYVAGDIKDSYSLDLSQSELPADDAAKKDTTLDVLIKDVLENDRGADVGKDINNNDIPTYLCDTAAMYFADNDEDKHGDPSKSVMACSQPAGYVPDNTDCDDTNKEVNPLRVEVCDTIDNNCNGKTDEDILVDEPCAEDNNLTQFWECVNGVLVKKGPCQ